MTTDKKLLGLEDAERLTLDEVVEIYRNHISPGLLTYMKILNYDKILVERAAGAYYVAGGKPILDYMGGYGSVNIGHNHPRIHAISRRFNESMHHSLAPAFLSSYAAALVKSLVNASPEGLDFAFLGNTGTEMMEAGIKIAEQAQGPKKTKAVYMQNSFHGKSKGTLSVTDSEHLRSHFRLVPGAVKIPFGDAAALESVAKADPEIGLVLTETIQGGGGINVAPDGYFQDVRRICDRYGLFLILDEIQCGLGRTGRLFAFEHEGIIPDIVAVAKSLGGAKTAMGAFLTRKEIYLKAYGTPKGSIIHGFATFGGIGEGCAVAMEALKILHEENLIENADRMGQRLILGLKQLQSKYPDIIKDIRGRGLMVGIEFHGIGSASMGAFKKIAGFVDDHVQGGVAGLVGAVLMSDYSILVAFTEYNRNVIRLEPPLVVGEPEIDYFLKSLDAVLSGGVMGLSAAFLASKARGRKVPEDFPNPSPGH